MSERYWFCLRGGACSRRPVTLQIWSLREPLSPKGRTSRAEDSLVLENSSGLRYGVWKRTNRDYHPGWSESVLPRTHRTRTRKIEVQIEVYTVSNHMGHLPVLVLVHWVHGDAGFIFHRDFLLTHINRWPRTRIRERIYGVQRKMRHQNHQRRWAEGTIRATWASRTSTEPQQNLTLVSMRRCIDAGLQAKGAQTRTDSRFCPERGAPEVQI